jgi:hypothetical protein
MAQTIFSKTYTALVITELTSQPKEAESCQSDEARQTGAEKRRELCKNDIPRNNVSYHLSVVVTG